ncbi:hypothetical protein LXL04_033569 [Taraxacum kok-saghyz]
MEFEIGLIMLCKVHENEEEGRHACLSNELELPFSDQEIKDSVWSCSRDKSPGPDGCTVELFKRYWNILGKDVMEAIKEYGNRPYVPKGVNSAFIALIPKKLNPIGVGDFRPISLVGIIQKVISKTMANRLKKVLHHQISPEQSAFVNDRQILDGPSLSTKL